MNWTTRQKNDQHTRSEQGTSRPGTRSGPPSRLRRARSEAAAGSGNSVHSSHPRPRLGRSGHSGAPEPREPRTSDRTHFSLRPAAAQLPEPITSRRRGR